MVARLESSGRRWWSWWWWTLASAGSRPGLASGFLWRTGIPRNPSQASKGASLARAASILP